MGLANFSHYLHFQWQRIPWDPAVTEAALVHSATGPLYEFYMHWLCQSVLQQSLQKPVGASHLHNGKTERERDWNCKWFSIRYIWWWGTVPYRSHNPDTANIYIHALPYNQKNSNVQSWWRSYQVNIAKTHWILQLMTHRGSDMAGFICSWLWILA